MTSKSVWEILKSPVITEKTVLQKEASAENGEGQVLTFKVAVKAGKDEIRQAVEEIFNVKVDKVRTVQYQGKMKRRGRLEGRRADWKKAYVTLKKGEPMVDYSEAI
jgi:large subunit ribosomal protein L23